MREHLQNTIIMHQPFWVLASDHRLKVMVPSTSFQVPLINLCSLPCSADNMRTDIFAPLSASGESRVSLLARNRAREALTFCCAESNSFARNYTFKIDLPSIKDEIMLYMRMQGEEYSMIIYIFTVFHNFLKIIIAQHMQSSLEVGFRSAFDKQFVWCLGIRPNGNWTSFHPCPKVASCLSRFIEFPIIRKAHNIMPCIMPLVKSIAPWLY